MLYSPSAKQVDLIDVPSVNFATIDGHMEPRQTPETSPEFRNVVAALYAVSYTVKSMSKPRKKNPTDYALMAVEGPLVD